MGDDRGVTASGTRLAPPLAEGPTGWPRCRRDAGHRSPWAEAGAPCNPRHGRVPHRTEGTPPPSGPRHPASTRGSPDDIDVLGRRPPGPCEQPVELGDVRFRQPWAEDRAGRTDPRPATTSEGGPGRWPCTTTTLDTTTTTPGPPTLRAAVARGSSGAPLARRGRVRSVRRAAPSHGRPVARRTNSAKARSNGGRPWQEHQL